MSEAMSRSWQGGGRSRQKIQSGSRLDAPGAENPSILVSAGRSPIRSGATAMTPAELKQWERKLKQLGFLPRLKG